MELISKYFPGLNPLQIGKFEELWELYMDWNQKINVISRKDIENLYLHHVLHSLAIAKYIKFAPGSKILDLGTGGGFPGIPLAIFFPEVDFLLIDGTRKKITVVQEVASALKLENVTSRQVRAEELKQKFDFVVTRAVAKFDKLILWSRPLIHQEQKSMYPNGIIALKGHLSEELKVIPKGEYVEKIALSSYFDEPFFEEKYLIYLQA